VDLKLNDDLTLALCPIERCVWQIALYAVHLATGHSIQCRAIKSGTIEKYLLAVATFCTRSNPRDPRKSEQISKGLAPEIRGVIDKIKRWENIPERREPFTVEMLRYLIELLESQPHIYGPDSSLAVMVDWASCGLYDGFRLSEWAQINGHQALHNPQKNFKGEASAFCIDDLEFYSDDHIRIPIDQIISLDSDSPLVGQDYLRYRTQKNGENGEKRRHARNPSPTAPCHITSMMNIVKRFARLVGVKSHVPLCVYRHHNGSIRYITASIIESTFRMAAAHVYKLDPVKDCEHLRKWSAHSLRVGACVILHGMGFTETQIQFLLRWKSTAFFNYLRNILGLSYKQNRAFADLSVMPNFV
jgi:hypothetical protein